MGFFTERCPNCGKPVSKDADYCNACGCPTASSWATCQGCGVSVGADSKFCWSCGAPQDIENRKAFYGDRWHRSPGEFAARVNLAIPEKILHKGLQVDSGTLALVFQDGRLLATLEPGTHSFDSVLKRVLGLNKAHEAHALLIDSHASEVEFQLTDVPAAGQIQVNARLRVLFQVADPKRFADEVVGDAPAFGASDIVKRYQGALEEVLAGLLESRPFADLLCDGRIRENLESELLERMAPAMDSDGLHVTGVRLARFGGDAVDALRAKLGEIASLGNDYELNRELEDALRKEKVGAYRHEQQMQDELDRILHEHGIEGARREEEKKRANAAFEHESQMETLRLDYARRRAGILNEIDEQTLRHQKEIGDAVHDIEKRKLQFGEDQRQQRERFGVAQEQQVSQAKTDLEVAQQGIEALKLVKEAKRQAREKEEALDLKFEAERIKLRGEANLQGLLATLTGEQADRVLKLAELEMRKGMSPEQALALVAEKSPEIAPAVAEALKARADGCKSNR